MSFRKGQYTCRTSRIEIHTYLSLKMTDVKEVIENQGQRGRKVQFFQKIEKGNVNS